MCPLHLTLEEHLLDMGAAVVDPFQKMRFLQREVEESVVEIPKEDVMKGLTLVGQEAIPQRQCGAVPWNPQQEDGTDGQTVSEKTLLTPRSSHHLRKNEGQEFLLPSRHHPETFYVHSKAVGTTQYFITSVVLAFNISITY